MKGVLFFTGLFMVVFYPSQAQTTTDYSEYHTCILNIEEKIVRENYREALNEIETLVGSFDFVFLRDLKIAIQLAVRLRDSEKGYKYLRLAISNGLTLKEVRREKHIRPLLTGTEWHGIKKEYGTLRAKYDNRIRDSLRDAVHNMYKKDQKLAFKYLLRIGQKAKERYINEKGIAHTRKQMDQLTEIMASTGYPGEGLIGEAQWMSTILAHHNSISEKFVTEDTLYLHLRPKLLMAISKGEMNPYDFAIIEDWRIAVLSQRKDTGYGYLNTPTQLEVVRADELRNNLKIRSIALRNGLIDIQEKTGMNFYIDGRPWVTGKIVPKK